jgi:hypothetical protein
MKARSRGVLSVRSGLCAIFVCALLAMVPRQALQAEPVIDPVGSLAVGAGSPRLAAVAEGAVHLPLVVKGYDPSQVPTWITVASEDFEAPNSAWQFLDANGPVNGEYRWGRRSCRPYDGAYSGWAVGGGLDGASLPCGTDYPDNASSWMVYGPFSLAGASAAELHFTVWLRSAPSDEFCYGASSDGASYSAFCLTAQTQSWVPLSFDLGSTEAGQQLGKPQVWVALVFRSDAAEHVAEGAYVDDVVVRKCVGGVCPPAGGRALPQGGRPGR